MKRMGVIVVLMALVAFSAQARDMKPLLPHQLPHETVFNHAPLDHQVPMRAVPAPVPVIHRNSGELDEILGDLIEVGDTYYNSQHNGTVSRMIGFFPPPGQMEWVGGDIVENVAFFCWMDKPDPAENVHIKFNRGYVGEDGAMNVEIEGGYPVGNQVVAAYTTLGMNSVDGVAFPAYHGGGNDDMNNRIASELSIFRGLFSEYEIPVFGENQQFWPHVAFAEETGVLHMVTTENPPEGDYSLVELMDIAYSQHTWTPEGDSAFQIGNQVLTTPWGRNISADIAVSDDGQRIVIGQTIGRKYFDENATEDDWHQLDNDIFIFESLDGGETWDSMNVSAFIPPDYTIPDSLEACKDTLRAYNEVNVYIDHDDVLHVAFNVHRYWELYGTYGPRWSLVYHWDEESNDFTVLANGMFDVLSYDVGVWQRTRQRPSMYQDPKTGILWCAFQGFGHKADPDTTVDISDAGFANAEIYVTASPPSNDEGDWYGRLWAAEVNITNTEWFGDEPAGIGECESECDPSLSLNNDGDDLHIFYVKDYLGGNARQEEGAYTLNDAVWHKVPKADLLARFEEQAEWLPNYPFHIDSSGFWEDEFVYAWEDESWNEEYGNFFRTNIDRVSKEDGLMPHEFALAQNYPNPFNPTTHIGFSLARRGAVKLVVYDVLGRQVATLTNRVMNSGSHSVSFDGSDLASGMYFVKLSSGTSVHTRKMVLMK